MIHLHTKEHAEKNTKSSTEAAWRKVFEKTNEIISYPNAPTKRVPICGLQFFEPATAWFCKLCEVFMGDTWCASAHLKSELHTERYAVSYIFLNVNFDLYKSFLFNRNSSRRNQSSKKNGWKPEKKRWLQRFRTVNRKLRTRSAKTRRNLRRRRANATVVKTRRSVERSANEEPHLHQATLITQTPAVVRKQVERIARTTKIKAQFECR